MPQKRERCAELRMQPASAVAYDGQAAALGGAIVRKGSDDDVTTRLDRTEHGPDIGLPFFRRREEMKDRPVVPHIVCIRRKACICDIR